jgi:hypothetical protein
MLPKSLKPEWIALLNLIAALIQFLDHHWPH